jgi:hypothetical protein
MTKTWARLLTLGLLLTILGPIYEPLRGARGDSFPLSWYPMFSRARPALEPVTYMLGLTASGERHVVHSKHHVQGAMNRARRQLVRLAKTKKTSREICEHVAERFSRRRRGTMSQVVQIWLVKGKFDLHGYFSGGNKAPVSERIRWACQVPGRQSFTPPERGRQYHYETQP